MPIGQFSLISKLAYCDSKRRQLQQVSLLVLGRSPLKLVGATCVKFDPGWVPWCRPDRELACQILLVA